jgi:hypothetical protein
LESDFKISHPETLDFADSTRKLVYFPFSSSEKLEIWQDFDTHVFALQKCMIL